MGNITGLDANRDGLSIGIIETFEHGSVTQQLDAGIVVAGRIATQHHDRIATAIFNGQFSKFQPISAGLRGVARGNEFAVEEDRSQQYYRQARDYDPQLPIRAFKFVESSFKIHRILLWFGCGFVGRGSQMMMPSI
jgi:hypothetical protein